MISEEFNVESVLLDHARYAWDPQALVLLKQLPINRLIASQAGLATGGLFVPTDVPFDAKISPSSANCFGVEMTLLHPFEPGDFPEFQPVPDMDWLWRNAHGALMLSFNISGVVEHFLGFGEEMSNHNRDEHGRLPLEESTLQKHGVVHDPLLNKFLFAILAVAKGYAAGQAAIDPREHVLPPCLVLSHDCDQLRGNDFTSQMIRIYRFLEPLRRLKSPVFSQLILAIKSALFPRRYFFDDALAMLQAEQRLGFRSAFYFLNGVGGRFGARSGSPIIADFAKHLPNNVEIGIHYNYRYIFDRDKLLGQIKELETLTGRSIRSGRAHYLIFDPKQSFDMLQDVGIQTDESMGFSSSNGFRLGFAGAFRAASCGSNKTPIVEIPLHFMDSNTEPRDDELDVLRMSAEIEKVGGIVTMLFHPGAFNSPENPRLRGLYQAYLSYYSSKAYRSFLPSEITQMLNS